MQSTPDLQKLLDEGTEKEAECRALLKALPPSLPEYQLVLEKLYKLIEINHQIRALITVKA